MTLWAKNLFIVALLTQCVFCLNAFAVNSKTADLEKILSKKIAEMSTEEKIGQMFMIDLKRKTLTPESKRMIAKYKFGNVILFGYNLKTRIQSKALIAQYKKLISSFSSIPPLIAVDQEGGDVNRLKTVSQYRPFRYSARTFGKIYEYSPERALKLYRDVSLRTSLELSDLGINMNLAPVLDTTGNSSSYIYKRSFSGDPEVVAKLSMSQISQLKRRNIISTGKHFPNLSNTRNDSHSHLPTLNKSKEMLLKYEFVPFKKLNQSLGAIMIGHVMIPQIDPVYPASMSKTIIDMVRKEVGFSGIVITDDIKMKALSKRYSINQIITQTVNAGADMIIVAWDRKKQIKAIDLLKAAVRSGKVPMARINQAVRNILRKKISYFKTSVAQDFSLQPPLNGRKTSPSKVSLKSKNRNGNRRKSGRGN